MLTDLADWYKKRQYPIRKFIFKTKYDNEYVYIVKNPFSNLIKIGKTNDFIGRMKALGSVISEKPILLFAIYLQGNMDEYSKITSNVDWEPELDEPSWLLEGDLHIYFKNKRVVGEWFKLNKSDIDEINYLFEMVVVGADILYGEDYNNYFNEIIN